MGTAVSAALLVSLLLTRCCSILAILQHIGGGEDEPRRNYRLEEFLWSGSGDGEGSGDGGDASWATTTIFRTTTILTTVYPTPVFPQPCPSQSCVITPTPTFLHPSPTVTLQPTIRPPYFDVPDERYWLVTVLETNGTGAELSPTIFEQRLARLYRTAFHRQQEKHLKVNRAREKKRDRRDTVSVSVHRMRRKAEEGRLVLVYTVRVAGKAVDANVAAQDIALLQDHEVTSLLGFPVLTKAEPFLKGGEAESSSDRELWLIVAGSGTAVILVVALIILFLLLIGKKKKAPSRSTSRSIMLHKETDTAQENLAFQDDSDLGKSEERETEVEEEKPLPRSYKPSTPNSYLSMPSVKAFPRGAAKPGPLEDVLEGQRTGGVGLSRHSSDSADPGVVGPLVWDLHCHRLSKKDGEERGEFGDVSVGRMRRRFHELLDDAFSLFGSGSASPEEHQSPSNYNYPRAKSAVILPVEPISREEVLRPRTTEAERREDGDCGPRPPRGAWGPASPPGSAPLRPFSAGPFHTPALEPAWILSDSSLKPTDPALPLIKAIKSELDKFPQAGSYPA